MTGALVFPGCSRHRHCTGPRRWCMSSVLIMSPMTVIVMIMCVDRDDKIAFRVNFRNRCMRRARVVVGRCGAQTSSAASVKDTQRALTGRCPDTSHLTRVHSCGYIRSRPERCLTTCLGSSTAARQPSTSGSEQPSASGSAAHRTSEQQHSSTQGIAI
jgi:hypothetical protein